MIVLLLLFAQSPIDFADYLYSTGDYKRAALEYERIGFSELTDTAWASYALLKAGEALLRASDPQKASQVYSFGRANLPSYRAGFTYGLLRAGFAQDQFTTVDSLAPLLQNTSFERQGIVYHAFSLALSGDKSAAIEKLSLFPQDNWKDSTVSLLNTSLKHRSPWLSVGMSTILPGAGQAYCGRWGDAGQSFTITALFAGAAVYYFFFSQDTSAGNTVKVVVTASLGGLFWLANIYGAANAALDYNEFQERKRDEQLRNLLGKFDLEPEINRP